MVEDVLKAYFDALIQGLKDDASQKNQKIPVSSLRYEVNEKGGTLYGAHYFKYLFTGRGPGKAPPPEAMLEFIRKNPQIVADMRRLWKYITEKSAAYVIGQKIAKRGTDIYEGKKQGIDFEGIIENAMPDFLKNMLKDQALKVSTELKSVIK